MEKQKWLRTAIEAQRRLGSGADYHSTLGAGKSQSLDRRNGKGRLARLHEIARELGIAGSTLRNYLNALAALEKLDNAGAAKILSQHSAVAVLAYCRWAGRAPVSAEQFLYANPDVPLAQLLSAERADRMRANQRHGFRLKPELDDALVSRLSPGPLLVEALGEFSQAHLGPENVVSDMLPAPYKFAGLDRLILSQGLDPRDAAPMTLTGAIMVPRLAILDDYAKRSRETWWRASSASALCPLVLVVFPGPAARRRFLAALPPSDNPGTSIFSGVPQAPRSRTGRDYRPIFFRTGPGHGLILVTSLLTLERDICA